MTAYISAYFQAVELLGGPQKKELQRLGLTGEPVAFWGFANTDIYQCVPVDTLHQCFNGISLHLVEASRHVLTSAVPLRGSWFAQRFATGYQVIGAYTMVVGFPGPAFGQKKHVRR